MGQAPHRDNTRRQTGMAKPDVRPPGAASPSAKSISGRRNSSRVMAGRMKNFSENTSTIPEVMDSSTLNFKANFKFSRFLWGGDPSPPSGVCQ